MKYLVFDCVLNKSYLTLVQNGEKINKTIVSDENNYHSVYLANEIQNILQKNKLSFKNLDFIGVDIGPASFTGIRVGLCLAKIIASEAKIPCVPVRSVDILSQLSSKGNVFLDARRGSYIYYNSEHNELLLIPKEEAVNVANKLGENIIADTSCTEYFYSHGIETINYEDGEYNIGEILAEIALNIFQNSDKKNFLPQNIKPLYIQTPPVFKKN